MEWYIVEYCLTSSYFLLIMDQTLSIALISEEAGMDLSNLVSIKTFEHCVRYKS